MRSVFVFISFLAALGLAAAGFKLDFLSDLNLTSADTDFTYRYMTVDRTSFPMNAFQALGWCSVSVDAETASPSAKASGNAIAGVGALPGLANVPFGVLAYGSGEAAVDVNLMSFLGVLLSANPELESAFEGGALGLAVLGMQEYDSHDEPVGKFIPLTAPFTSPCSADDISGDDGNLEGLSCTFSPMGTSADVTVTYIVSNKAGFLNYGNTPVSPRSLEMVVEVEDFPLSDSDNHVRMTVGFFTAAGVGEVKGTGTVVLSPDQEDLYTATAKYGVVDGERVEVQVDIAAGSADLGVVANSILTAALGGNYDANIAYVDFPAGVSSFIYDPIVGAGSNVYEAAGLAPITPSSASTTALSLLVVLISVFICFF